MPAAENPVDVDEWVQRETLEGLLRQESELDRTAVLQQSWAWRPPTWIQNHSAVNLGDFPTLDDPTGAVERNLQTLEWALAEQRRLAGGQRPAAPEVPPTPFDDWVRRMAPQELVSTLKENREWVAASGATLLVILWSTTLFARRPVRHVTVEDVPKPAVPRRRRRSRHASDFATVPFHRTPASTSPSGRNLPSATRPAPLGPAIHRSAADTDPSEQDTEPMPLRAANPRADAPGV